MAHTVVLHKRPDYPSFGIYIGEDFPSGIYIVTIDRNSPAATASIRPGDRILAFNGHLVASMSENPKDRLIQTAASAQTLTLSVQSTDVLQTINGTTPANTYMESYPHSSQLTNTFQAVNGSTSLNWDHETSRYSSQPTQRIDGDLEGYIKSLFSDPTLQIVAAPSGNRNEFLLVSDKTPSLSSFPPTRYDYPPQHQHQHHHHRKRRHHSRKEISSVPYPEPKEDPVPLTPNRSVPSMGTSHAMLRNSQLSSKDSAQSDQQDSRSFPTSNNQPPNTNNNNNPTTRQPNPIPPSNQSNNPPTQPYNRQAIPTGFPPPYTPTPPSVNNQVNSGGHPQPFNGVSQLVNPSVNPSGNAGPTRAPINANGPPPVNGQGVREVHLRRMPDFQGFGFHLQYNKVYYIISSVENNSPAERGGLHVDDIIREVNHRPTNRMPHSDFVDLINSTDDVTFIVQPFDDYQRANPMVPAKPSADRPTNIVKNDADKRPNILTKALTKLKSR